MEQAECFRLLFLHLFFGSAQSLMYFMMALDMLLAIGIPIRHKVWPKITYVIMMCVPPILFAFIACVISYSSTERGTPKICGPQATTAHGVATLSMFFLMAANTAAVVMVIIVVVITRRRGNIIKYTQAYVKLNAETDTLVHSVVTQSNIAIYCSQMFVYGVRRK
ncbi:hypothetical protein Y032_0520g2855 [Ancylostoma ceylanicum]|uniref:G-protein coupled receptors family 1 profile domain-containing protein n=1 Tax=Ancylostoma ceylanicum TaxID=53326 RepID=A0A016WSD5_9BILA|nr:hypothetical protein Y032_0520g2855 [Ancylostoma ceylanicum]